MCIYKKPDGVCYNFDKKNPCSTLADGSKAGFDTNGYCVVDVYSPHAYEECSLYDTEDDE